MRSPDPVTDEAEEASDRLLQKMAAAQSLEERESMGEGKRIGKQALLTFSYKHNNETRLLWESRFFYNADNLEEGG